MLTDLLTIILWLQEAGLDLTSNYRECFVELHHILKALKMKDMGPALEYIAAIVFIFPCTIAILKS